MVSVFILGYGYPFERRSEWRSEMWNETFILVSIHFTMFFSAYISNVDVLNGIGYCFCGLLFSHLIINITIIAVSTIRQKIKEFRHWMIIRRELMRLQAHKKAIGKKIERKEQVNQLKRRLSLKRPDNHDSLIKELDN